MTHASRSYGSVDELQNNSRSLSPILEASKDQGESSLRGNAITETPRAWIKVATVCGFAIVAITAMTRAGYSGTPQQSTAASFSTQPVALQQSSVHAGSREAPPLAFTAVNFYHTRDGTPAQDYPWLKDVKLIEPHRETTLAVTNSKEGMEYRWTVRVGGTAGDVYVTASGAETTVSLTKLDEHVIVLEEVNGSSGEVSRRLDEAIMVKYVRREIRTLTDDEREELLDAVSCLFMVSCGRQTGHGLSCTVQTNATSRRVLVVSICRRMNLLSLL